MSWVDPGETYDIKLGAADPIPISMSVLPVRSCGASFDLREGDSFALQIKDSEASSPTCEYLEASVGSPIDNVTLGAAGDVGATSIAAHVEARYSRVTVGRDCRGKYRLGLNDTESVLRAYRFFRPDTVAECAAEGANVDDDNNWCWDSWRVEVTDSNGKVVATSLE